MKIFTLIHTILLFFGLVYTSGLYTHIQNQNETIESVSVCDNVDLTIQVTPSSATLSCDFPCVTLSASGSSSNGSYSISWLNNLGQSLIQVCEPGTYTAVITDYTSGCIAIAPVEVEVSSVPVVEAGDNKEISCISNCTVLSGAIINVTSDISIDWTGPDNFTSNQVTPQVCVPGKYFLSVHEVNGGCTIIDSVLVTEVYAAINSELQAEYCPGDCYEFNNLNYCETGNYEATFLSSQGCDSIVHLQLTEIPINAQIDVPGIITCNVPELSLNTNGSTIYPDAQLEWSTIDGNFISDLNTPMSIVDQAGTYVFTIKWNGCTISDTVLVDINQIEPEADAGEDVELDCISLQATLNAAIVSDTLGKSYSWTGPNQFYAIDYEVVVDKAGVYELTVHDNANGCFESDEVIVKEYIEFVPEIETEPSCFNETSGSIKVLNSDNALSYKYSIRNSIFQDSPEFESLQAGNYQLVWLDDYGCGDTLSVNVPELAAIDLKMEDTYSICGDNYITLNAAVNINETPGPVTYLWNDDATSPALRTNRAGNFWVEISSACEVVKHEIEVVNDLVPIEQKVYIPNAFSPNDDKVNDLFRAYINHEIIAYQLQVFDRRGSLMFSTEDPLEGWDGAIKGKHSAIGVYTWWLRITIATCGDGRDQGYLSGDVTLFR